METGGVKAQQETPIASESEMSRLVNVMAVAKRSAASVCQMRDVSGAVSMLRESAQQVFDRA